MALKGLIRPIGGGLVRSLSALCLEGTFESLIRPYQASKAL